ncbi:hybrid sensor histidine kinase/response regulator [Methylosinus sporium]|nr:response regulator [Methylosinus sporium]
MMMTFLSRFSIPTKIAGGFGALICLLIAVAAISYQGLTAARSDFGEYRRLARQNNALARIQTNLDEIRLHADEWLLGGREESIRRLRDEAARSVSGITEATRLFEDDRRALDVLRRIEADGRDYVATFFELVKLGRPLANGDDKSRSADAETNERDRLLQDLLNRLGPAMDSAIETMRSANFAAQDALGPRAATEIDQTATAAVAASAVALVIGLVAAALTSAAIIRPITTMTSAMRQLAEGDLSVAIPAQDSRDEIGVMASALQFFKEALIRRERRRALNAELAELSIALQLATTPSAFAEQLLAFLAPRLSAGLALFFVRDADKERFHAVGGYACDASAALSRSFEIGEGLPGQCVASRRMIVVTDVPRGSHFIGSGLSAGTPDVVVCVPVGAAEGISGVIEFARYGEFPDIHRELLDLVVPIVALNLGLLERNLETSALLTRTSAQAEELRAQTDELQTSEEELRLQREELQIANDRLAEKSRKLEEQAGALEAAKLEAEMRADELAETNRYKSQFLANMSHELRTPLNSILILANTLAEDEKLDADEIESAKVIGESGNHLLALINDILDLAKIEAGKLELVDESIRLDEMLNSVARTFAAQAERKAVALVVEADPATPPVIRADRRRLVQVLFNLVGNAVKFTDRGEVRVVASPAEGGVRIAVSDTGVGIAPDQIETVFSAFHQADGAASRRYGGTGLGLTISRDLVTLMGGRVEVASTLGAGSVFSVFLPADSAARADDRLGAERPIAPAADARRIEERPAPADSTIFLIESDPYLAAILGELIAGSGYRIVHADSGGAASPIVAQVAPTAILLDLDLRDLPGLEALRRLKSDPAAARIPVYAIASNAEDARAARSAGAMGSIDKPVKRDEVFAALSAMLDSRFAASGRRRILIVDDNAHDAHALRTLFRRDAIDIVVASSGDEAIHRLMDSYFDAVVLDLMLPDMSGFTLLESVHAEPGAHPPVVVYSAHDLTTEDIYRLRTFAESVVFKGRADSRLREEVLQAIEEPNADLVIVEAPAPALGRRLLLVDDDPRNLLALSKSLRARGFDIEVAANGAKALEILEGAKFDAVLTDIMMPDMDGYELIGRMRARFERLPIVALTAKAMPGDAEQCLRAGATAYLAKPIDSDRLLETLARWLI